MTNPTLIFSSSWLLEDLLKAHARAERFKIVEIALVNKRVKIFEKEWEKENSKILKGIQLALGVGFREKTISVWISGRIRGGRSMPLIVSASKYNLSRPVDIVMHELIHRISVRPNVEWDFTKPLSKLIPSVKKKTIVFNHVYVHAVSEHLYRNVIKDIGRLNADKKKCEKSPSYKKAWQIVEKLGYKRIINAIKKK